MLAASFRLNPLSVAFLGRRNGVTERLEVRAFAYRRSFHQMILERETHGPLLDAVEGLVTGLRDPAGVLAGLERGTVLDLWRHGVLLSSQEPEHDPSRRPLVMIEAADAVDPAARAAGSMALLNGLAPELVGALPQGPADGWTVERAAGLAAPLAADGAVRLDGLIERGTALAFGAFYGRLADDGWMPLHTGETERFTLHNDPAARRLHLALTPLVAALAGRPVKATYSFASVYCGGTSLPMHLDRAQCELTISLMLRQDGVPEDQPSTWPLIVTGRRSPPDAVHYLAPGDAVLFFGRELMHGRPALPPDQRNAQLMLHYVDAGFTGTLD